MDKNEDRMSVLMGDAQPQYLYIVPSKPQTMNYERNMGRCAKFEFSNKDNLPPFIKIFT